MARPPTALSGIFYQYDTANCYDVLRARGALSWKGRLNKAKVIELLNRVIEQDLRAASEGPPMVGPSTPDRMQDALLDSPYISMRGRLMSGQMRYASEAERPWWKFWQWP